MKKFLSAVLLLMTCLGSTSYADDGAKSFVSEMLKQIAPRLKVVSSGDSPMPGVYEVVLSNGDILYANPKSKAVMIGQMLTVSEEAGLVNLTDQKKEELSSARNGERKALLDAIGSQDKVTYSPEGDVKARVHIFTDISCPYCVKLHREVPELNKMGIEVSYLAFPRAGKGSNAHKQMNSIWCAGDDQARRDAMDKAKSSGGIQGSNCDTQVIEQMVIGQNIGVNGTPAIIFENGELVPGYVPAKQLAKMLNVQ
jgi:thiol:disulfide interchange protein DsbC